MDNELQVWSEQFPAWAWNIGVVIFSLMLGILIKIIITGILHFYKNRTDYSLFKSIITHLGKPLNIFVPLLTLNFMQPLLRLSQVYLTPLDKVIGILLVISFANLLINSIKIFEDFVYHQYDLNKDDNLKERKVRTQLIFIRKVIIIFIVLVTLAIILLSFENVRKIGDGLLTGVGISSIIVGFAAQNRWEIF